MPVWEFPGFSLPMYRAIFLDRDGVINQKAPEGQYVTTWEQMRLLPGVAAAIALLKRAEFQVFVISNQRCIARGLITPAELEALHQSMCDVLARDGAVLDDIYYCPHDTEPACGCRKPAPGMILDAARAHQIDLSVSWMIGDSDSDVEAGQKAGCKTGRLLGPNEAGTVKADVVASSLLEMAHRILERQGNGSISHMAGGN